MSEEKKNLNLIFIFSVIFLLIIIGILFCYFNTSLTKKAKKKAPAVVKTSQSLGEQAEEMKKSNEGIIKDAMNQSSGSLKKINEDDYIMGDIDAPVQIIVYDDLDNEFSADYDKYLKEASDYFGDKVVVAYRNFPMRSHANSLLDALAVECAGEQGSFLEMRDAILANKDSEVIGGYDFAKSAEELGLDSDKFKSCLDEEKYIDKIQASIDEANLLNVIGVPTTFLNERMLPGAYQFEDFTDSANIERQGLKSIIEEELAGEIKN